MPAFAPLKEKTYQEKNEKNPSDVVIPAVVASVILVVIRIGSKLILYCRTYGP